MEPGLSNDSLETAREIWRSVSSGQQTVVITSSFSCGKACYCHGNTITILSTVESKASFSDNIFTANHPVNINIYIKLVTFIMCDLYSMPS